MAMSEQESIFSVVNRLSDGDLARWIREQREDVGRSWEQMTWLLRGDPFHLSISTKTLRRWWDRYLAEDAPEKVSR